MEELKKHILSFFPFAKDRMGFNRPPKLFLKHDGANAKNTLGKTAQYNPEDMSITLFTAKRHPKDILRSFSHELVHHAQNCRGDFDGGVASEDGYAQSDSHLREMEREAYEQGNLCFRDWEDSIKYGGEQTMSLNESKLRGAIRSALKKVMSEGAYEKKYDADGRPEYVLKKKKKEEEKKDKKAMKEGTMADDPAPYEAAEGEQKGTQEYPEGEDAKRDDTKKEGMQYKRDEDEESKKKKEPEWEEGTTRMEEEQDKEAPLQEWYQHSLFNRLTERFTRK